MRMREQRLRMRLVAAVCAIILGLILTSIPESGCVPCSLAFFMAGGLLMAAVSSGTKL